MTKPAEKFAKISEVKIGTILIADGGFPCIREGAELEVFHTDELGLHVPCKRKTHRLDVQIVGDEYVGFYLKGE